MSTTDELNKLAEAQTTAAAEPATAEQKILTLKDALDQMQSITQNLGTYTSENEKKLAEKEEELNAKLEEFKAVFKALQVWSNDKLPAIIKIGVEASVTADFKTIAKTESEEFHKQMLTALNGYEERIKRASESVVKRNEASLTNRIKTGGFWLIVAVTFSVAFFRFSGWQANRNATADAEFGRKAKVVIESWQAPARKSFLELIGQTK